MDYLSMNKKTPSVKDVEYAVPPLFTQMRALEGCNAAKRPDFAGTPKCLNRQSGKLFTIQLLSRPCLPVPSSSTY
jgi:hypothetical protein